MATAEPLGFFQNIARFRGWMDRDSADRFADYAESCLMPLGDRVAYWATHNEPWVLHSSFRQG